MTDFSGRNHQEHDHQEAYVPATEQGVQTSVRNHTPSDPLLGQLRELHRRRQDFHRAEKSLTLQMRGICRRVVGGDKDEADTLYSAMMDAKKQHDMAAHAIAMCGPFISARDVVEAARMSIEKQMKKVVKKSLIWPWVRDEVPGLGDLGLAGILGECSVPPGEYRSPAALRKRFGLAVIDGQRQRRVSGDAAVDHGYSPSRRSLMWNVGNGLVGGMGHGVRLFPDQDPDDPASGLTHWQRIYYKRLRFEARGNPEFQRPLAKTGKESFSKHAHYRAKRYLEQKFLKALWQQWRKVHNIPTEADPWAEAA